MERPLGLVDGFGRVGIGQPISDRLLVRGSDHGRIKECRLAVGCSDRDACHIRTEDLPGPDNGQPCPAGTGRRVGNEPLPNLARAELAAPKVETRLGLRLGRGEGGEQPVPQHPELEVVEQLVDLVAVPRRQLQLVGTDRQVHVAYQLGELAVHLNTGHVGSKGVAHFAFHLVCVLHQTRQRPVLPDPLRRGLLPHTGNAGEIVRRIATQSGEVRVLRRRQPVLLLHLVRGEPRQLRDAAFGVENGDVVGHQLQRVAVAGDHQNAETLLCCLRGQRGDDVVGFVTLPGQNRDAHRPQDVLGEVDLATEFVRRRAPLRLVLGEDLGTERLPRHVESGRYVARVLVAQQVDQHRGESVHGVGGLTRRGLEVLGGQRKECAERQRVTIEQHQGRLLRLGR